VHNFFIRKISAPSAILFVNFTCLGFAFYNGHNRGVVNIDYLISIFLLNKKFLFIIYASLISIVDFLIIFSKSYNFTPVSFLENWEMLGFFNYGFNIFLLFQCLFFLVTIIIINYYVFIFTTDSPINNKKIGAVVIVGALLLDVLFGSFYTNGLESKSIISNNFNINPSTSGLASLIAESNTRYFSSNTKIKIKTVESALYQSLNRSDQVAYPRKIVLIVIESYGLFNDEAINNELLNEFRENLNENYQIGFNSIRFNGATTSGEIRELCGVHGDYHDVQSITEKQECLPSKLLNQNYTTSAFHYYYKSAFNRGIWWPKVGLVNVHFLDSHAKGDNGKLCGGFLNGGCDKYLISDLFDSIENESKSFSYALTLNSHLPLFIVTKILLLLKSWN
jgi:phosphoglycerol transferase MdoB-like AlkP superfamily enzyme